MNGTKEAILQTALSLFARDGYEAVSVSMIAGELNVTKGALYRHYKSKREIFDSIVRRMEQMDSERAAEYEMPEENAYQTAWKSMELEKIKAYTRAQFIYWTEEEFSSNFRKLLTLEQYRNAEMAKLYQMYVAGGPLFYTAELFRAFTQNDEDAQRLALDFYGPVFLLYSVYDGAEDKAAVFGMLCSHLESFELK